MNRSIITENAFDRLNADWRVQCADAAGSVIVAGWLAEAGVFRAGEALGDLSTLLAELARRDRVGGRAHSDLWLAELLRHAIVPGGHAQLAARVVVQAMLPSAFNTARRLRRRGRAFTDAAHAVTGALYEAVGSYPLQRRPRRIAANLSMCTLQLALQDLAQGCQRDEDVPLETTWSGVTAPDDPAAAAELADITAGAAAAGLLSPEEDPLSGPRAEMADLLVWALREQVLEAGKARCLASHYRLDPVPDSVVAREEGVSPAAVRQWRSRAKQRLRNAAEAYVAAA